MNKETYLTEYPKHESEVCFYLFLHSPSYFHASDGERSFGDITQQRIGFIIKKKSRSFIRTKNGTETVYIADQPIPVKMEFTIFTQEM